MKLPTIDDRLAIREKPSGRPVMFQRWSDLLFLHWEIDPDLIRERIPDSLSVDLFEGKTYLGLVPFSMERVRPRFMPPVPWLSNFLELNVRAYVHDANGRPGVWFFSLDCNQPIAVELARKLFHLPYQHARMTREGSEYRCQRKGQESEAHFRYQATPPYRAAEPGSLEFFLLERYLLFSESRRGQLYCGQVHHQPYQFAERDDVPFDPAPLAWENFTVRGEVVSALTSPGVPVEIYPLRKCGGSVGA